MLRKLLVLTLITLLLMASASGSDPGFFAYYTRIQSGEEFEEHARIGDYADVIVQVRQGLEVVFWRGSSYLPSLRYQGKVWDFEEIVPRSGDGPSGMPDRHNRYSYVRIIENQPDSVVIHWRYVPDFSHPGFTGVVDEYFYFFPDGRMERTVRRGTRTLDEWESGGSLTTRFLQVDSSGIHGREKLRYPKDHNGLSRPAVFTGRAPEESLVCFHFDESRGSDTYEAVSGQIREILGHRSLWKQGVSGASLHFDGYSSMVSQEGYVTQDIHDEITLTGWVAAGAYPFEWGPVVQQSTWGQSGFYLGLDKKGRAGFHLAVNGSWYSLIAEEHIELFQWHYLAGTFSRQGEMKLYIDGEVVASEDVGKGRISLSNSDLTVGLNTEKLPPGPGRIHMGKYPSLFGLDGQIDEVQVYPMALDEDAIFEPWDEWADEGRLPEADMEQRKWPEVFGEGGREAFGASYTKLDYYETWDNMWRVAEHPDVVVGFDNLPCRIVSWRGLSSGPVLVTENNLWVGDQSSENYKELDAEGEAEGCCEHMSDKQCRHAHIRIIENTPARVVLHYRYGMVDSRYIFPDIDRQTGWGDWADEIWTIYPDGVAVRHLERGMIWGDSWVETMFFSAPGQRPEEVVEAGAYTMVRKKAKTETLSWEEGSPEGVFEDILVSMVNTRSEYRPYNIYPSGSSVEVFGGHGRGSLFHWWNHWPVSQITSDGRGAWHPDRAAHSSLVWGIPSEPFLMYGLSDKKADELLPLSRSWNHAPPIHGLEGAIGGEYQQEQRAYSLVRKEDLIRFSLGAGTKSPVLNPCFEIRNWGGDIQGSVSINGQEMPQGPDCRQGIIYDTDGTRSLVVWLKAAYEEKIQIEIRKKDES